ncbi:hypothetical protein RyT2_30010 [Pseudolactococcus yaeyamensis]
MNKYMISFFNYQKAFAVPITFEVVEAENEEQARISALSLLEHFVKQNGEDGVFSIRKLSTKEYQQLIDLADEIENS